jgi:hypothetical protein
MFTKSVVTALISCSSLCLGVDQEYSDLKVPVLPGLQEEVSSEIINPSSIEEEQGPEADNAGWKCQDKTAQKMLGKRAFSRLLYQDALSPNLTDSESIDAILENSLKNCVEKKYRKYPHFTRNPCLSKHMKKLMAPHLLPKSHPTKKVLDKIFSRSRVITNKKTLRKAGFKILFSQHKSFVQVVSHPRLKGYLLKLYLDSDRRVRKGPAAWKRLTVRCIVAKKIKRIIAKRKVHTFVVADKWLYPLPAPKHRNPHKHPVVLIVKDMKIYNRRESGRAWRKKASWSTIKGLYKIFSRGYGSAFLSGNVPYTKKHKFAFIDTEFDKRKIPMRHAYRRLSPRMWKYWKSLVHRRGKRMLRMGVTDGQFSLT